MSVNNKDNNILKSIADNYYIPNKSAIIISSITFGIGHILNLFNGAELVPTLLQICYAMAGGYLFVMVLIKSNSLWPCIITHSLLNSLSIFNISLIKFSV